MVYAVPSAPPGGSSNSSSVTYKGNTTISSDTEESDKTYSSETGSVNALLVSGGTCTINNPNLTKSGDASGDEADFYGVNAGILVYNGATLNINGGTYETSGQGSPAIYSTANITVNNASLTSTSSEGVVVEGTNSVTLNNTNLTDTNNTLNGNSETYKNIFLYQSMSGDASVGEASFTAKNSNITTNKGDTIFVTNTTATINLENNTITNNDGDFLRIQTGKWGNSGSNGGNVTLNMSNQKVEGNIIVDSISTLDLSLTNGSV